MPDQFNAQVIQLGKGPVAALNHVTGELAARLLQSGNGAGRRDAAAGAALGKIPVAAGLLYFLNFLGEQVGDQAVNSPDVYFPDAVLPQARAGNMDKVPVPVGKLLFVDGAVVPDKIALPGGHHGVAEHRLIQLVDIHLTVLHDVHIAKAGRGPFIGEQGVRHKGVLAVVIPAAFPEEGIIFAGKEHCVIDELAVMKQAVPLVVPVHHSGFFAGVHTVVIEVLAHFQSGGV